MTNWIEHNGGPQPVADDVVVEIVWPNAEGVYRSFGDEIEEASELPWEGCNLRYRIINQHLIDAARKDGIRLGLEAAVKDADARAKKLLRKDLLCAQALYQHINEVSRLNPETIAKEAQHD